MFGTGMLTYSRPLRPIISPCVIYFRNWRRTLPRTISLNRDKSRSMLRDMSRPCGVFVHRQTWFDALRQRGCARRWACGTKSRTCQFKVVVPLPSKERRWRTIDSRREMEAGGDVTERVRREYRRRMQPISAGTHENLSAHAAIRSWHRRGQRYSPHTAIRRSPTLHCTQSRESAGP